MTEETGPDQELIANVFARGCSSRAAFETVTGRWASLVLLALADGPHRFGELRRRVEGVSEKMLSQALHGLEREGLLVRTDHGTLPPRVDYALTELGADIAGRLRALADLLEGAVPELDAARAAYARD
ncbi:helix-turn-helix domain-containing protein [Demequina sp. SYSU T00039]|uniref:Helix-turn-helix domain-containing protein n=1 Tax=Demequina lignilytica TaxID=3051663 RepID=A0AAW7MAP0_9MICO|nr:MULTISPECIES: helix-turn-helix domain-containing protein [unclassified Demequina]MDN4479145.1 helix-turn-helix domain-containing protein [Demequina sp. SYSU T00039-1]MDN4489142.1 helix-turn-helix domain-containing protein [Demequina sp. SYSU T00039]MDN4490245.1 helix-turn-helix domain-containing protein [Demequina sp. SYSU T00068]